MSLRRSVEELRESLGQLEAALDALARLEGRDRPGLSASMAHVRRQIQDVRALLQSDPATAVEVISDWGHWVAVIQAIERAKRAREA